MVGFLWAYLGSTKRSIERGGYNKHFGKIPFLNVYYFMKVSHKPTWFFLLMFVPFLSLVIFSIVLLDNLSQTGDYPPIYKTKMVLLYPVLSRGVL
jgi:hypothetical protein